MGGKREGDFEDFLQIRRHVRRLQTGSPLLLRTVNESGQEELKICTFCVSEDLQVLRWKEAEGSGSVRELPISAIATVHDESVQAGDGADDDDDDEHFVIVLKLREKSKRPASLPLTIGLICSSSEDLESWREGLKFLIAGEHSSAAAAAEAAPAAGAAEEALREKLKLQEQLCERLQQENGMLREIVKRKDATIAELLRDSQTKPLAAERCNKTESTSRESDDHLQFREVAILRRKNRRLQKDLKAKQQTVQELLKLLSKVTQQEGAESSAQEEETAQEDAGEDEEEEEQEEEEHNAADTRAPAAPVANGRPVSAVAQASQPAATAAAPKQEAEEPELFRDEMAALAAKLQALEEAAAAATQGVMGVGGGFQPPPRTAAASPQQPKSPAKAGSLAPKSAAALDAVAREMALLEEKKRVVERLARSLEPGGPGDSDEEEDGFPLR